MTKIKYPKKVEEAWEDARPCYCNKCQGNPNQHRLCAICLQPIQYGCYESVESQRNSIYAWNVDHIIPQSQGGSNSRDNRQAVHIKCNREKGSRILGYLVI